MNKVIAVRPAPLVLVFATSFYALCACTDGHYVEGDTHNPPATITSDSGTIPPVTTVPPGRDLPCEVARVVAQNCSGCHGETPSFGAPMSLMTRRDFLAFSPTDASREVSLIVTERVQDDRRPMPPSPHTMSEGDQQILLDWISGGLTARADDETCEEITPPDLTAGVGPEHLPCEPSHTFLAAAPDDSSRGFTVPVSGAGNPNTYVCFPFRSPFAAGEQATHWAPIIDNEEVVHHWILWGSNERPHSEGPTPCEVLPANDAAFVTGWAPGGQNAALPDDVGLDLGYTYYYLQLHYWNPSAREGLVDRSGVSFCTTPTPRPNTAGVLTLGSVAINIPPRSRNVDVNFECPGWVMSGLGELNILSSGPHMHQLATSFLSEIIRADGTREDVGRVDRWDFDNQTSIPLTPPLQIRRGDRLGIRCTYDNASDRTVHFGEGSEDEMCFDFMLVYPIQHLLPDERFCLGIL